MAAPVTTTVSHFGDFARALRMTESREALLSSDEGTALLDADLATALSGVSLVSVDVFDTVLLRPPVSELRRFWEFAGAMQSHLGVMGLEATRADLLLARISATRAAYRLADDSLGSREGRFDDILRGIGALLGLSPDIALGLAAVEVATEAERFTVLNATLWSRLRDLSESDIRVVLFSDMYLGAGHIRDILGAHGVDHRRFTVHTSGDERVTKLSGHAFPWLASRYGVDAAACLHIGDHPVADLLQPIRSGWRARLWPLPDSHRERVRADFWEARRDAMDAGVRFPFGWLRAEHPR